MTELASGVLSQARMVSRRGSGLLWRWIGDRSSPALLALASSVCSISLLRQLSVLAMELRTEVGLNMSKSSTKSAEWEQTCDYIRNSAIEQCARVAECYDEAAMKASGLDEISKEIAAAIRALKDKHHGQETQS